jgi:hypothetical protein
MRRSQASCDDNQVYPRESLLHGLFNRAIVIANGNDSTDGNANAHEAFTDMGGVAVYSQAADHFVTNGNDFCLADSGVFRKHF